MKLIKLLFFFAAFNLSSQVSPLLSTKWNQTCFYNEQMPNVGSGGACGKAYTGCNATAMAQICKYYAYPTTGFGSHCNTNSPTNCVDYSMVNYNYSAMPNTLSVANPEVASLIFDLGVSVDMTWNGSNSTSFFSPTALKQYYAYSPKMYSTATYLFPTSAALVEGIKQELNEGRPVFAKGGGHFYLIDGYDLTDKFHMNFGWGGTYDGYYSINSVVNLAGTFTPSNFIFNIKPLQGSLETAKDTIYIPASGASVEALEFTSSSNWIITSSESWILSNLASGSKGYFNYSSGSHFSAQLNNGNIRTAYLYIQNSTATDTMVVIQAAPNMQVTPDSLSFTSIGGTEIVTVLNDSWANWNVVSTASWMNVSSATGTGNGSFQVIVSNNPSTSSDRTAYVVVTDGVFTDSIYVHQLAQNTVGIEHIISSKISVYPNPADDVLYISGYQPETNLEIVDVLGVHQNCGTEEINGSIILNTVFLAKGIYFIISGPEKFKFLKE